MGQIHFRFFIIILLFPLLLYAAPRTLARIQVTGAASRTATPLSVALDRLPVPLDAYRLHLVEHTARGDVNIPCQVEATYTPRLWWVLSANKEDARSFELVYGDSTAVTPAIKCETGDKNFTLSCNGAPVLSYRHAVQPAPEGVDTLYNRSGFIHPLYTPDGGVLTRIQPPDHYHHVGIWNPWTKTHIDGREVDFWNLGSGLGTVRYAGLVNSVEGPVYGGFRVRQEHIDLKAPGGPQLAINEEWDVRVWNLSTDNKVWLWELTTVLNSAPRYAHRTGGLPLWRRHRLPRPRILDQRQLRGADLGGHGPRPGGRHPRALVRGQRRYAGRRPRRDSVHESSDQPRTPGTDARMASRRQQRPRRYVFRILSHSP